MAQGPILAWGGVSGGAGLQERGCSWGGAPKRQDGKTDAMALAMCCLRHAQTVRRASGTAQGTAYKKRRERELSNVVPRPGVRSSEAEALPGTRAHFSGESCSAMERMPQKTCRQPFPLIDREAIFAEKSVAAAEESSIQVIFFP